MNWGRSAKGDRDHQILDGKGLCGAAIVEIVPFTKVSDDRRCKNCDEALRAKGKDERREATRSRNIMQMEVKADHKKVAVAHAKAQPRAVYTPRMTFRDWEMGR